MRTDRIKAIGALGLTLGVISLGVASAMLLPGSSGGPIARRLTPVPQPSLEQPTPEPTTPPLAFEGWWDVDFEASGLVRPTRGGDQPGISSSLLLSRGQAHYGSGYDTGCELRSGPYQTAGLALEILLSEDTEAGCHEAAIDEVLGRLTRVVAFSLESCPAEYLLPSGDVAPASCRQLWLYDQLFFYERTTSPILVYAPHG